MKKTLRWILCIISLALMLISLFYIAVTMAHGNVNLSAADETTEIHTPVDIGNAQYTFVNDNFIYIASTDSNIVQLFSLDGEYLKGILIPSAGGTVWMGTNAKHELYIYSVRKNLQIILDGDTHTSQENVQYINENDFYQKASIVNSDLCRRDKNIVFLNNGSNVTISAPVTLHSLDTYFAVAILSFFVFIIASGLLAKMTYNSKNNIAKNRLK